MDPGVGASEVHTLEEALHLKEIDTSSSLSEKQIIGAFDKLFVLEVIFQLVTSTNFYFHL